MMTKDEERKLLGKIEALLKEAEPDGYIDLAFRGCVDMARDNINNDWAVSPMDYFGELNRINRKLTDAQMVNDSLRKDKEELQGLADRLQESCFEFRNELEETKNKMVELGVDYIDMQNTLRKKSERVEELVSENIRLKARLFDYMESEATK